MGKPICKLNEWVKGNSCVCPDNACKQIHQNKVHYRCNSCKVCPLTFPETDPYRTEWIKYGECRCPPGTRKFVAHVNDDTIGFSDEVMSRDGRDKNYMRCVKESEGENMCHRPGCDFGQQCDYGRCIPDPDYDWSWWWCVCVCLCVLISLAAINEIDTRGNYYAGIIYKWVLPSMGPRNIPKIIFPLMGGIIVALVIAGFLHLRGHKLLKG